MLHKKDGLKSNRLCLLSKCQWSFRSYQVPFPEDAYNPVGILHGKTDIDPPSSEFGKKYFIPPRTLSVSGKPRSEIPGSMDSPFAVPDGRFLNLDPFNIGKSHHFFLPCRIVVVLKDDGILCD